MKMKFSQETILLFIIAEKTPEMKRKIYLKKQSILYN